MPRRVSRSPWPEVGTYTASTPPIRGADLEQHQGSFGRAQAPLPCTCSSITQTRNGNWRSCRSKQTGLPEAAARQLVEVVRGLRELPLRKSPSISETIDWARTLTVLGVDELDAGVLARHPQHRAEV